jgi:fructose-specific phosphotransferase system IIC component
MAVLNVVFCDQDEAIKHLFISCPFTQIIGKIVYMTFNISPPLNITNLFGNWLNGMGRKDKAHIRIVVCALVWAHVYLTRGIYSTLVF